MLQIKLRDVRRATLPQRSGNEGWIGISPNGDAYHVVVPVDAQIARGVMACNQPSDGTPFGGYARWIYFHCDPYESEMGHDSAALENQVRENAHNLKRWCASYGIDCEIASDAPMEESREKMAGRPFMREAPCRLEAPAFHFLNRRK